MQIKTAREERPISEEFRDGEDEFIEGEEEDVVFQAESDEGQAFEDNPCQSLTVLLRASRSL